MIVSYTTNWIIIYDRKTFIVQATGHTSRVNCIKKIVGYNMKDKTSLLEMNNEKNNNKQLWYVWWCVFFVLPTAMKEILSSSVDEHWMLDPAKHA